MNDYDLRHVECPEYASPAVLVARFADYANAIRSGEVLVDIRMAGIDINETECREKYGVPARRWGGNCDTIARKVAIGVIQEMIAGSGIYFSGTFEWGVLPRSASRVSAQQIAEYLIATRDTNPRARAESMSAFLTAGQMAAESF
jgi:hypothetical protein